MHIEELIRETKKTKDEENIKKIIEYYEPSFCEKISKNYGKEYVEKAKEILPSLVDYYFSASLKDSLSNYLRKKSKTVFTEQKIMNFDDVINSENKELIKIHYTEKFYNLIKEKCYTSNINDDEIKKLSEKIINDMYNSFLKSDKKSSVSNYFNSRINVKINMYRQKDELLLDYIVNFGVTEKLIFYFCYKYINILGEFRFLTEAEYEEIIKKTTEKFSSLHCDIEYVIRKNLRKKQSEKKELMKKYIEEIKQGNEINKDKIKKHYSYIIDVVISNFKNKVSIPEQILREKVTQKYDDYFNAAIESIKNNTCSNFQRYINTRLSDYVKRNKIFYNYADVDERKIYIKRNVDIVDKYASKYCNEDFFEDIQQDFIVIYYYLSEKYFSKYHKKCYDEYIKSKFVPLANKIAKRYKDDSYFEEKEENPIIK